MPDLSPYLRNALYDAVVRGVSFSAPAQTYLALFTGATEGEEVSVGGYARRPVAWTVPVDGDGSNVAEVTFGPLDGTDTVTHAALFDAPVGGNRLTLVKALVAERTWDDGGIIFFAAGDVLFAIG